MNSKRRVLVIGSGTAGLCALKHALVEGMDVVCYEKSVEIGGTWVYSDTNVQDCQVKEVHSSMYEGLRTNLPKEVMGFPDFTFPEDLEESFVSWKEVLRFLQSYADHFQLRKHIKFQHDVIRVRPRKGEWEAYIWDLQKETDNCIVAHFDYVFVCNGHYTTPVYPSIEGRETYKGHQIHSHLYRKTSDYKDATVLIIGAGPSGMDIANHIHKVAQRVFLSHHMDPAPPTHFMPNVTQKPDVDTLTETGAIFKDGTTETFSHIIYCTGYKYDFPCLSSDTELRVTDNYVHPLYKHCININHPTMALIGLPFKVCPTQLFDLQVRFALKFYTGQKQFPSREEMLEDMDQEMQERWESGQSKRQAHSMGKKQFEYYTDLAETAGIANIKPVIGKIMEDCGNRYIYGLDNYRNNVFKIIDDDNFIKYSQIKS